MSRPGSAYSVAATDYSTDGYDTEGGESYGGGFMESQPWAEYWDEQAQAKYWYNNESVSN